MSEYESLGGCRIHGPLHTNESCPDQRISTSETSSGGKKYPAPPHFVESWKTKDVSPEENNRLHREGKAAFDALESVTRDLISDYGEAGLSLEDLQQKLLMWSAGESDTERQEMFPGWTDSQLQDLEFEISREIRDQS